MHINMHILNLRGCDGLLDPYETQQHAVHAWIMRAVVREASVTDASNSCWHVLNASFTYRHPARYACYDSLVTHARAQRNTSILAVSFHISTFIPRYAARAHDIPSNIRWVVMENTYPRVPQLVIPYVTTAPKVDRHVPWQQRSLLLFAGHLPKPQFSRARRDAHHALQRVANITLALGAERMSSKAYLRATQTHKFCLVAPGDTHGTRKLAETISIGAHGGCVPLILSGTALPYTELVNYSGIAYRASSITPTLLARLREVDEREYARTHAMLSRHAHMFEQPRASDFLLRAVLRCEPSL